ncbi:L-idonate 5-dehydrogenase [Microlunatus panaciterrae]|uniref:L-idonate 5-dehydrogenase n=1 Tax=Microlunatus panaciterrae TaxID=400768 RepID=A0ABS2RLE5_9ACTN|nr:L-idonate 5-dehydrogenase [Microlunatus panaciterrae]MBM7799488.1 L-idonate 5-dehydrogenase [Microlunatus panaciterrae]
MKAVVAHGPMDLRVDDLPEPSPAHGEALVRIEYGGICGSDLGYWRKGQSGTAILRHPMVLGHEVAGVVVALGDGVSDVSEGQPVAIHPATVCGRCTLCREGRSNLCPTVRYLGSAAFDPHWDGAFCVLKAVPAAQLRPLPEGVGTRRGAVAEPLGVALHAVRRAGDLTGRTVLVNGCGPIGALVVTAARRAGAVRVVVADLSPQSLAIGTELGADDVVEVAAGQPLPADVDVAFEASGAPGALGGVIAAVVRGGVLVQVGSLPAGPAELALGALVSREIDYRGAYRFVDEITEAVAALASGLDVDPLITHTFDATDVVRAFGTAADRSTGSSKVLLRW